MVSPGDEAAADTESQPRLRASAADREQVIEVLKVAFVQERITKDELDQRIGKVFASRTYDDLDILTADIPGALIRARPAVPAQRPDVSKKKLIRRTSAAVAGAGFVTTEAVALPHHLSPVFGVIAGLVAGAFTAGLLAVLLTLIAWAIDRSVGRQPSQGPPLGALDNAAQHPAPADPAEQPRQSSRRLRPGAEAARGGLPRSSLAGLRSPRRLPSLTTLALFPAHSPVDAGHDSERAAVIYQHEARGADKAITDAYTHSSPGWADGAGMTRLPPQPPHNPDHTAASILEPEVPAGGN